MSDIYMRLVKEAFEGDELDKLLKADPKYIYDENHNYRYATSPEQMNMREDEIDPISYSKLVDGIKLYDFSLKNNRTSKSQFETCVVNCIQNMAQSDDPIEIYFAARITYILYIQKLRDPLPKYYVLNCILNEVIDEVRISLKSHMDILSMTYQYGGKYRDGGLLEFIRETMDSVVLSLDGDSLLGE